MRKKNPWNLPPWLKANIDYYLHRKKILGKRGAAFNGQTFRTQIVSDLIKILPNDRIIETGTYLGSSTLYFAEYFSGPVITVECMKEYFLFSKKRLRQHRKIDFNLSDSITFLNRLSESSENTSGSSLFYLDAHWHLHLPLKEEVNIILNKFEDPVMLVDDFQVPDDPGYGYDDYGQGNALTLEYLRPLSALNFDIFFPAAESGKETGEKRGCVILCKKKETTKKLKAIPSLRYYGNSSEM
ncbi:hypothetical protein MNBD_GAMMA15-2369 [hydrothermal vent metagenome]|uniref:Uncharacterized protein n=1 Tax=hydrothermal vent metagenome TaxID=652676 RepID=A0A3B0Z293_9ZZZZ